MSRFGCIFYRFLSISVAVGLLASCATLAERAADAIFPNLTTYFDTEAPATVTSYPASSSISAVLGGQGRGLNCSIPSLLELALFHREQDESGVSLQFRQGCTYHDYCYRHGHATYGYTRADCDYSLQQIAYRDCRLISDRDPKECMARARLVLLGVTVGGGKSFASGGDSSYFEFDPMPAKADDYVTVRWVRSDQAISIEGRALNGEFVVMHYKRGTVSRSAANFDPRNGSATPREALAFFPGKFIPTPPWVVRNGGEDRLLAIARDNYQNTAIEMVEYWPKGKEWNTIKDVGGGKASDRDASVFWFRRDGQDHLSYWSHTSGFGTFNEDGLTTFRPKVHDVYRTLQHVPVEGRFFDPGCLETAVLKRGGLQTSDADDTGWRYNKIVHLTFVSPAISPCVQRVPVTLAAAQANEPLGVARLDSGRDVLVSVLADYEKVKLAVFDLAKASGTIPLAATAINMPFPLDPSWLKMPPQILFDAGAKTSIIFFSQFVHPAPQSAQFNFQYFRLASVNGGEIKLAQAGGGACVVDLSQQLTMLREDTLGGNITRAFPERLHETLPAKGKRMQQIDQAILGNLVERWSTAQLIPGWFVKRDDEKTEAGPLDVAVFFNGYSKYSFLAEGRAADSSGQPSGFLQVAPSYVTCQ